MTETVYKDLSELTLMDDYMFGVVMQDPAIAKTIIEQILGVFIRHIEYIEPQKTVKERYDAKGVRLDLFVEDENGSVYNVEIQTTNKRNLPKRMRYYQSIIDLHVLKPGANYNTLRKSYVIFICNYDPFARGRCVYTFENRCLDDLLLPLGDETTKVVVNITGVKQDATDKLREILDYLNDGSVTGPISRSLETAVNNVRNSEERRREYMVMMAHEMEIREETRAQEQNLLFALYKKLNALGRMKDFERAAEDPAYLNALYEELNIRQTADDE